MRKYEQKGSEWHFNDHDCTRYVHGENIGVVRVLLSQRSILCEKNN